MTMTTTTTPNIGDIMTGNRHHKHVYSACSICGVHRWVELRQGKPWTTICAKCNSSKRMPSPIRETPHINAPNLVCASCGHTWEGNVISAMCHNCHKPSKPMIRLFPIVL